MKAYFKAVALAVIFISLSCNRNNQVFEKYPLTSPVYKDELYRQIKTRKPGELTFTLDKYFILEGKHYLYIKIKGSGIDAKAYVLVTNWAKIESLKRTEGVGYSGSELEGLKFEFIDNDPHTGLLYNGLDRIVD